MALSPTATEAVDFGKYRLVARLATGGMAEIFLARLQGAAGFDKLVCIKRILPHLARDKQFVAMFLDEARIASRITHANVCQVFELGEIEGSYYLAMEYLEGVPLSCFRRGDHCGGPPDPRLVAGIAVQVCEGLHHAHQLKNSEGRPMELVHRDVSPQNLFVTADGIVKVLDFGIAKIQDATVRTSTGALKGTYPYMAPEQLRGERLDRRSDVFALGITMWETLARRHLFKRDTEFLTFQAIAVDPIEDVRALRPDVPAALAGVIAKALSRDRDGRFATARMLGEAIASAIRPLAAPAISEEIARGFPGQLGAQAELIRVARAGGAFALDIDRGPSAGHAGELSSPDSPSRRSPSRRADTVHEDPPAHDPSRDSWPTVVGRPADEDPPAHDLSRDSWPTVVGRPADEDPPAHEDPRAHDDPPAGDSWPTVVALPAPRVRWWRAAAFVLALAAGSAGVLLYATVAGTSDARDPGEGAALAFEPVAVSAALPDAAVPDASVPDASVPDASVPDASPPGAAPSVAAPQNAAQDEPEIRPERRPTPARPSRAQRPNGPPGWITIDSQPWATIFIDGKDYGPTPVGNVALSPGRHRVRAVTPSGAAKEFSITIESGKTSPPRRVDW